MPEFIRRRLFLLGLLAVLTGGMVWPQDMRPVLQWLPSDVIVAAVTLIMALPMETRTLWTTLRRPIPVCVAALFNVGVAPPLGWLASRMLPPELEVGMIVATTVPCTLATAAVWTRRAGGNDAVAFLVTMITNLSCFLVVPVWLWLLVGVQADFDHQRAKIDYGRIVVGLISLVVLPIVVGQLLRQWRPIAGWASRHKQCLSAIAQCGVLLLVLVSVVVCRERIEAIDNGSGVTLGNFTMTIVAVTAVHLMLVFMGLSIAHVLQMSRGDAIAVAFSGSQKTLTVGAYLALAVSPLAILPMVTYHVAQLLIDAIIADWWLQQ